MPKAFARPPVASASFSGLTRGEAAADSSVALPWGVDLVSALCAIIAKATNNSQLAPLRTKEKIVTI